MATRRRRIVVVIGVVVALSRLVAVARSLWDWDEALFCISLHDYNVAAHHPHPPGFPLYVFVARVLRHVITDDFRTFQTMNTIAAMLLFPVVYKLARAFRFDFEASVAAGLLFAFLPNVWFLGGTAFSDVSSLCILLFAVSLLLRASETPPRNSEVLRGSPRYSYFLGCFLLGVSLSFRPQNFLIGAYPIFLATWQRLRVRWTDVLIGAAIGGIVVTAAIGGAALVTGVDDYRASVHEHGDYVMHVDGYKNPNRPPSWRLSKSFLLEPFGGHLLWPLTFIGCLAVLRARRPALEVLATFGPFFLSACFVMNPESISRYSITYLPATALLGGEGMWMIAGFCAAIVRRVRARADAHAWRVAAVAALAIGFVGACVVYSWSGLADVRRYESPPTQAMHWIRTHVDPKTSPIYVHDSMGPWAEYYLTVLKPEYRQFPVGDDMVVNAGDSRGGWFVTEGESASRSGHTFARPRGHLYGIARRRFFTISVRPLSDVPRYADGWYDQEGEGSDVWRWMGESSVATLPPLSGNGVLWFKGYVPLEKGAPTITVTFNGNVIDRFTNATHDVERRYVVPSRTGTPNELRLQVDRAVTPPHDGRALGFQLRGISWMEK